jgi:hypothetical protein
MRHPKEETFVRVSSTLSEEFQNFRKEFERAGSRGPGKQLVDVYLRCTIGGVFGVEDMFRSFMIAGQEQETTNVQI